MSTIEVIAAIATGVGTVIMALSAIVLYLYNRGKTDGGVKTDIVNLTAAMNDLRDEVERGMSKIGGRADDAHNRIDSVTLEHHALREMIAKEYVTYERMRELKTDLMQSVADGTTAIHSRLDQLIQHMAAQFKPSAPQDSNG